MRAKTLRAAVLLAVAVAAPFVPVRGRAASLGTGAFAIENVRIVTVSGGTIEKGTVVIRDGKIAAVGASVSVPSDAKRIDATGLSVYPGMIDSATRVGLLEIGAVSATNDISEVGDYNPHLRAYEAFNPNSEHIPVARVAGVTTVVSMPAGGTMSGQPLVVDLAGDTVDDMVLRPSVGVILNFPTEGARSAFDSNAYQVRKSTASDAKKARDKKLDEVRSLMRDAEAYAKAMDAYAKDPSLPIGRRNLKLAGLLPVLRGELPFVVRTNDERDIRAAVAFADEMKVKMILVVSGESDVAKAAPLLAQKKIPVVIGSMYTLPAREDERYDLPQQTAAALAKAGVTFAFSTGDYANVRDLPYNAAMAVAYSGLSKEDALKAITLWPAQIWGVADRVGSIEVGKYANLIVTTGDPLEVVTDVKHVFIEGKQIPLVSRHTQFYDRYDGR
jgi:imidazolonepropionase-like amidohydrolase